MKLFKSALYISLFFILFMACTNEKADKAMNKEVVEKEMAENLKNVEVQIKGMTCEIGCAKLIQSKLYKVDGIKFAQVSFADSLGNITYDANSITTDEIKNMIQKIAGGDLYEVTAMNEVVTFKEINK